MKNLLVFNLLFLITSSFAIADNEINCPTDPNSCEVKMVNEKKQGKEICRALDNPAIVMFEAEYNQGELNGPVVCRNFLGMTTTTGNYEKAKKSGEFRRFNMSEKEWVIEYFASDEITKMVFKTDENMKVKNYVSNCKKNGESALYHDCLDEKFGDFEAQVKPYIKKMAAGEFKERNKDIVVNHDNGSPRTRGKLVNGQLEGLYQTFFESGGKESEKMYKQGYLYEEKLYYKEGQIKSALILNKGELTSGVEYYQNSKKSADYVVQTSSDPQIIKINEYYDTGTKRHEFQVRYVRDDSYYFSEFFKYTGEEKYYSKKGVLTQKRFHNSKGHLDGKAFYAIDYLTVPLLFEEVWVDGVLQEVSEFEGSQKKPVQKTEYYPDGSVKKKLNFKGGA
jgi:antitoxin component YwqK of YwqJK toxin-antitoxin module